MEQNIKNFDRKIEQMMNEQEVQPPFGVWNRIAAELDATAVPVAGPAPVNSFLPKRVLLGFIVGALVIGASVFTGYMVSNTMNREHTFNNQVVSQQKAADVTPVEAIAPAVTENTSAKLVAKAETAKVTNRTRKTAKHNLIHAVAKTEVMVSEPSLPATASQNDVVTPVLPGAKLEAGNTETFYFPPVDMVVPDKSSKVSAQPNVKAATGNDDDDDKKRVTSSNDQKIKFRPKKHPRFSYGRIIRNH